jgi:hypothetical protein
VEIDGEVDRSWEVELSKKIIKKKKKNKYILFYGEKKKSRNKLWEREREI